MVTWGQFKGTADEWDRQLHSLDGGLYQTYGWGEVRRVSGGWEPLRLIATRGEYVIAMASVLVKRKFGLAICWMPDGPVASADLLNTKFRRDLSLILQTHLVYCRISFLRCDVENEASTLLENGWERPTNYMSSGLTMLYDLYGDQNHRLQKTSGNWRHNLKRSSRYSLSINHWESPDANQISAIYREMELLKSLPLQHSLVELEAMIHHLNDHIVIFRCLSEDGDLLAIRSAGLFGERAWDLLAASGAAARKLYATHATLWALLNWCQQNGFKYYDLSGVDPIGNKGVYDFKHGTGANLVECLGEWEWASMPGLRCLVNWMISRKS
jgi:hypothetical protein